MRTKEKLLKSNYFQYFGFLRHFSKLKKSNLAESGLNLLPDDSANFGRTREWHQIHSFVLHQGLANVTLKNMLYFQNLFI